MLTIDLNTLLFLVRTTPNWCRTTGPKQDPNWLPYEPDEPITRKGRNCPVAGVDRERICADYKSNFADYSTFSMSQLRWSIHKTHKHEKGVFQYDVLCIIVSSNKFHNSGRWWLSGKLSFEMKMPDTTQHASMTSAKKILEDLAKMIFKTHEYLCHDWENSKQSSSQTFCLDVSVLVH